MRKNDFPKSAIKNKDFWLLSFALLSDYARLYFVESLGGDKIALKKIFDYCYNNDKTLRLENQNSKKRLSAKQPSSGLAIIRIGFQIILKLLRARFQSARVLIYRFLVNNWILNGSRKLFYLLPDK